MTDETRVTYGGRLQDCEVLYERGSSVRVRLTATGRCVTVPADRVVYPKAPVVPAAQPITDAPMAKQWYLRPEAIEGMEVHVLTAVPKPPKPLRSAAYMAHVRTFPCLYCGRPADEAHHHGKHAMGSKTDDYRCVPLCAEHHREWHTRGQLEHLTHDETVRMMDLDALKCLISWTFAEWEPGDLVDVLVDAIRAKDGER